MERERLSLPMVALRGMAVLPEMVTHFDVSREKSIQAIERAMEGDQLLFLAAQKDVEVEDPGIADVYETGCVVSIWQMLKLPKKITRVLVSGQFRAKIQELEQENWSRRPRFSMLVWKWCRTNWTAWRKEMSRRRPSTGRLCCGD